MRDGHVCGHFLSSPTVKHEQSLMLLNDATRGSAFMFALFPEAELSSCRKEIEMESNT
jgi:hypothetical protein